MAWPLGGKGFEQCSDRTAAHGLVTIKMINAIFPQAGQGGDKTSHVTGVAHVDVSFADGNYAALAGDGDGECGFVEPTAKPSVRRAATMIWVSRLKSAPVV